jgi:hypothetical protein
VSISVVLNWFQELEGFWRIEHGPPEGTKDLEVCAQCVGKARLEKRGISSWAFFGSLSVDWWLGVRHAAFRLDDRMRAVRARGARLNCRCPQTSAREWISPEQDTA